MLLPLLKATDIVDMGNLASHKPAAVGKMVRSARRLSERLPIDVIEDTFIGTLDTGHSGTPVFKAHQDQIDGVIASNASVMEKRRPQRRLSM